MEQLFAAIAKILTEAGVGPVGLVIILAMGGALRLLWVWHRDAVKRLEGEIDRAAEEKRYLQDKLFSGKLASSESAAYGPVHDDQADEQG